MFCHVLLCCSTVDIVSKTMCLSLSAAAVDGPLLWRITVTMGQSTSEQGVQGHNPKVVFTLRNVAQSQCLFLLDGNHECVWWSQTSITKNNLSCVRMNGPFVSKRHVFDGPDGRLLHNMTEFRNFNWCQNSKVAKAPIKAEFLPGIDQSGENLP